MEKLSQRLSLIPELLKHPYLGKGFKKLKDDDLAFITNWVKRTVSLTGNELQLSSVRLFLDVQEKPKHWTAILEFTSCIATNVKCLETET